MRVAPVFEIAVGGRDKFLGEIKVPTGIDKITDSLDRL